MVSKSKSPTKIIPEIGKTYLVTTIIPSMMGFDKLFPRYKEIKVIGFSFNETFVKIKYLNVEIGVTEWFSMPDITFCDEITTPSPPLVSTRWERFKRWLSPMDDNPRLFKVPDEDTRDGVS